MGIVHKLKSEILNFILESKKNDPALSCRGVTQLILEKFQITISKSSVNSIFKEHNLSMPIGRRQKHKKKKFNMPVLPVIEGVKAITVIVEPVIAKPPEAAEAIPEVKEEVAEEPKKAEISPEEKRIKEAEEWAKKLHEEERIRIEEKLKSEEHGLNDEDAKKKADEAEVKALLEEAARVKAREEIKERELEKAAQEAAENKRLEEEARKIEEERLAQEVRQRQQEEAVKAEEERKRIELEKAAQEALEKKRLEDERLAQETKEKAEQERLAKLADEEAKAATEKKRLEEEQAAQEAALRAEKEKWARLAEEEHKAKQQPTAAAPLAQEGAYPAGIMLKALDYLIGGSKEANEVISKALGIPSQEALAFTEAAIFRSLLGKDNLSLLYTISGRQIPEEKLDNYCAQLKQLESIKTEIAGVLNKAFTEARGVKLHFIDGSLAYLDGQLHSGWPSQQIPFDFCSTVFELKNNLDSCFSQGQPLVLFSAPGYDVVPKDFFTLLLDIGSIDRYPDTLTLFGNKSEDLEKISLNNKINYTMIFGLWPWQFTTTRKVKRIGEFGLKHIESINQDFYLAEIEIDLLRVSLNQSVSLKGCAVKTTPSEKIRLVLLSNPEKQLGVDELAQAYLSRWPNLDETFHDFSRKVELFTRTGSAQKFFPTDSSDILAPDLGLAEIFEGYIRMLDAYLRRYFLPGGYMDKNFSFSREQFYKIPVKLVLAENRIQIQMQPGQGYQAGKDLEYLIRRLNERRINSANGARIYFENAFK